MQQTGSRTRPCQSRKSDPLGIVQGVDFDCINNLYQHKPEENALENWDQDADDTVLIAGTEREL